MLPVASCGRRRSRDMLPSERAWLRASRRDLVCGRTLGRTPSLQGNLAIFSRATPTRNWAIVGKRVSIGTGRYVTTNNITRAQHGKPCLNRRGCVAVVCVVARCVGLCAVRCVALVCVAMRCVALRCVALRSRSRCAALRCAALRCLALQHVALVCAVVRGFTLLRVALLCPLCERRAAVAAGTRGRCVRRAPPFRAAQGLPLSIVSRSVSVARPSVGHSHRSPRARWGRQACGGAG